MNRNEQEKIRKEKKLFTTPEFANLVKKTVQTVDRWKSDGILSLERVGSKSYIQLGNSLLKLYFYYEGKANNKEENKEKEKLEIDLIKSNIENKKKDIETKDLKNEINTLKRDMQTGKYIPTDKVKEANAKFLIIFKNFALSIPSQIIGMVAHKLDKSTIRETQASLEMQINNLLNEFFKNGRLEKEQIESGKVELNEKGEEKKKRGKKRK